MIFLYFFPELKGPPSEDYLKSLGLDKVWHSGRAFRPIPEPGPNGLSGMMMHPGGELIPTYDEGSQTWRECAGGKYWLGFETDNPPGPEQLSRGKQFTKWMVPLLDGGEWKIPCQVVLPKWVDVDVDGKRIDRVCDENKALSAQAEELSDYFMEVFGFSGQEPDESDSSTQPLPEKIVGEEYFWEVATAALSLNYHVSPYEISALKLLDEESIQRILFALVDYPWGDSINQMREEIKKKEE